MRWQDQLASECTEQELADLHKRIEQHRRNKENGQTMSDILKCKTCKLELQTAKFEPAKTRRGFRMACIDCDDARKLRVKVAKEKARKARVEKEKENQKVQLSEVIKEIRSPAMISIVPPGSEWAKWWQELVDAEAKA